METMCTPSVTLVLASLVVATMGTSLCGPGTDLLWRRDSADCSLAYFCVLGREVTYHCPEGHVIGANKRFCIPIGSSLDNCSGLHQREESSKLLEMMPECKLGETAVHSTNCAKYYECVSVGAARTEMQGRECPYPQLFDIETHKCSTYKGVQCAEGMAIPRHQCDYESNQCRTAHCVPCTILYPSCHGLPDGENAWTGREWSPYYVKCEEERVTFQGQCKQLKQQQVFHPEKRTCVLFEKLVG